MFKPIEQAPEPEQIKEKKCTWGDAESEDGEPMYESSKSMMYGSPEYIQKFGSESIKLRKEKVIAPKQTYLPRGLRLK